MESVCKKKANYTSIFDYRNSAVRTRFFFPRAFSPLSPVRDNKEWRRNHSDNSKHENEPLSGSLFHRDCSTVPVSRKWTFIFWLLYFPVRSFNNVSCFAIAPHSHNCTWGGRMEWRVFLFRASVFRDNRLSLHVYSDQSVEIARGMRIAIPYYPSTHSRFEHGTNSIFQPISGLPEAQQRCLPI